MYVFICLFFLGPSLFSISAFFMNNILSGLVMHAGQNNRFWNLGLLISDFLPVCVFICFDIQKTNKII